MPVSIPEIRDRRLLIDGRRTLLVGAEVHNSSSSTVAAIESSFATVADLGAQVVLAPVAWDLLEPEEGVFDTALVDTMLRVAGQHDLLLVPLWFGSWKNGESSYVPSWIKLDRARFPRARSVSGHVEVLSPFAEANVEADARAFAALMGHLHQADTTGRVVMVQVENEVGLLGDARDRSAAAEAAWRRPVPTEVVAAIHSEEDSPAHAAWSARGARDHGTWPELLGDGTDAEEAFMAWGYASYLERVAAGAAAHPVPLFANTWLDTAVPAERADGPGAMAGGLRPGEYASGGPVRRVGSIWRASAPSLITAPDIYFGDVDDIAGGYARDNPVLLVPELRRDIVGVAQLFRLVGRHGAALVAPFGVDSFASTPEAEPLRDAYRLLRMAAQSLLEHSDAASEGFVLDEQDPRASWTVDGFTLTVDLDGPVGADRPRTPSYGMLVEEGPASFLAIGRGFTLTAASLDRRVRVLSADEVVSDGQGWRTVRRLGGDETAAGMAIRLPGLPPEIPSGFAVPRIVQFSGAVRVRYYAHDGGRE